jgi:hypothetical protein
MSISKQISSVLILITVSGLLVRNSIGLYPFIPQHCYIFTFTSFSLFRCLISWTLIISSSLSSFPSSYFSAYTLTCFGPTVQLRCGLHCGQHPISLPSCRRTPSSGTHSSSLYVCLSVCLSCGSQPPLSECKERLCNHLDGRWDWKWNYRVW